MMRRLKLAIGLFVITAAASSQAADFSVNDELVGGQVAPAPVTPEPAVPALAPSAPLDDLGLGEGDGAVDAEEAAAPDMGGGIQLFSSGKLFVAENIKESVETRFISVGVNFQFAPIKALAKQVVGQIEDQNPAAWPMNTTSGKELNARSR